MVAAQDIRRRKKGESFTDLAEDGRKLMVLTFPQLQDRTTEVLARDSFLEALEDPELIVQVQAQFPPNLDCALRIAQLVEAVFQTIHSRVNKPVRVVSEDTVGTVIKGGVKDPWVELINQGCPIFEPAVGPAEFMGSQTEIRLS